MYLFVRSLQSFGAVRHSASLLGAGLATLSLSGFAAPAPKPPADRLTEKPAPALLYYNLTPGVTIRYRITARVKASIPILDNPVPSDLNAVITLLYDVTPKARLSDGTMDVEFKVKNAEVELEKIPFPLPQEQVADVLNQTVTLSREGTLKRILGGKPLPFGVSIPGIDPKRLNLMLFPIVFQQKPVGVGDTWDFKSDLLGGNGAETRFSASVLPSGDLTKGIEAFAKEKLIFEKEPPKAAGSDKPAAPRKPAPKKPVGKQPTSSPADSSETTITRLSENFRMTIDQKLDAERKPLTEGGEAARQQKGTVEGVGVFHFNRTGGHIQRGAFRIKADITDERLTAPKDDNDPKQIVSKVDATVTIELLPLDTKPAASPGGITNKEKP